MDTEQIIIPVIHGGLEYEERHAHVGNIICSCYYYKGYFEDHLHMNPKSLQLLHIHSFLSFSLSHDLFL